MKFRAEIDIMPLKEILDPQGKAVKMGLDNLGLKEIDEVRIGKHITLTVEAQDETEAKTQVEKACQQLLANQIMESYQFNLTEV